MLPQHVHQHLAQLLSLSLNKEVTNVFVKSIGGGSINQTYQLQLLPCNESFFCKINSASRFPHLFLKEKIGLQLLGKSGVIKVPQVIACSQFEHQQLLVLEWIESGTKNKRFFGLFGEQLAALHRQTNTHFGLHENNYMGSVPQQNNPAADWCTFFAQQRLQPLVEKCVAQNLLTSTDIQLFEKLYQKLHNIFDATQPPALLHGDLWSGNYMCSSNGEPVLIDPAVYYGHPAMDLGMTTLFGGFDAAFYESYQYHAPLPSNYKDQWAVASLYPLLIHLFLFGKNYLAGIRQTAQTYA